MVLKPCHKCVAKDNHCHSCGNNKDDYYRFYSDTLTLCGKCWRRQI